MEGHIQLSLASGKELNTSSLLTHYNHVQSISFILEPKSLLLRKKNHLNKSSEPLQLTITMQPLWRRYSKLSPIPLHPNFLWSSVLTFPLVFCTHCSSGPLDPLVLCTHCSSVPTVPLFPLFPLFLCSHCPLCPLFPLFLLFLLFLWSSVPTGPLYQLFLCSSVPLFLCSSVLLFLCSSVPLFLCSSVPTFPLVLCTHPSSVPTVP